jgi:hypothetical protein
MADKTPGQNQPRITRRSFLQRAMAAASVAAGAELLTGFPLVWAQRLKDIPLLPVGGSYAAIIDLARVSIDPEIKHSRICQPSSMPLFTVQ